VGTVGKDHFKSGEREREKLIRTIGGGPTAVRALYKYLPAV
jgi:hypothetical protein